MLKQALCIGIFAIGISATSAMADTNDFRLLAPAQSCTTGMTGDVCHHVYDDSKVEISFIPVSVDDAACLPAKVELLQLSTRLEAEIPDAVTPATASSCQKNNFSVNIPVIKSETEFEIRFSTLSNNKWQQQNSIRVIAYPHDLIAPIRNWAESKDRVLILSDKEGKLADFFDRKKISYTTRDTADAKSVKAFIVTGQKPENETNANTLYLTEKIDALPIVLIDRDAQKTTVTVQLKMLDLADADDPLAAKMLVKLFNIIAK